MTFQSCEGAGYATRRLLLEPTNPSPHQGWDGEILGRESPTSRSRGPEGIERPIPRPSLRHQRRAVRPHLRQRIACQLATLQVRGIQVFNGSHRFHRRRHHRMQRQPVVPDDVRPVRRRVRAVRPVPQVRPASAFQRQDPHPRPDFLHHRRLGSPHRPLSLRLPLRHAHFPLTPRSVAPNRHRRHQGAPVETQAPRRLVRYHRCRALHPSPLAPQDPRRRPLHRRTDRRRQRRQRRASHARLVLKSTIHDNVGANLGRHVRRAHPRCQEAHPPRHLSLRIPWAVQHHDRRLRRQIRSRRRASIPQNRPI